MFRTIRRHALVFALTAALAPAVAHAADTPYSAELSPVSHTLATRATVLGKGIVNATLSGRMLTLSGSYSELASAATRARLMAGAAMGVPGEPVAAELTVTGGTSGRVSGRARLTPAQLKSLRAGGLAVVIDSEKAPEEGNVWGWLVPPTFKP